MTRNIPADSGLKLFIIVFTLLFSFSSRTLAAEDSESSFYGAIDNFVWKEFNDDGSKLLKESGILYGIGFRYRKEYAAHVTLSPSAEIFGGIVDYDGQACDVTGGGCQAAQTDVDYFGFKLEGEFGQISRFPQSLFLEPFGGLGIRYWLRDINDGNTADGSQTAGYLEEWLTIYGRLGLRGGKDFSNKKRFSAEAGIKVPLYNQNTAHLSDAGLDSDVTLKPGKRVSFFVETGMQINTLTLAVFYDSLRFSESDVVASDFNFYMQPKSNMDVYGIKLGVVF